MLFRWIPREELNRSAIARMKANFGRPDSDPPEAWFMSEKQRYFSGLYEALIRDPPNVDYVQDFLEDVGGGIKNFGRFPEWVHWYLFLLPFLLERIFDGELLLHSLNYFFNLYPDDIPQEYPEFRDDVLLTLGQCVMASHLWEKDDLAISHWWFDERSGYFTSALNASMMFCVKYLTQEEMRSWVTSIVSIKGERWQHSIRAWLHGLRQLESFVADPRCLPEPRDDWESLMNGLARYLIAANIYWDPSYIVFQHTDEVQAFNTFLPAAKREAFWEQVRKYPHLLESTS